jgi:hypothetical protein
MRHPLFRVGGAAAIAILALGSVASAQEAERAYLNQHVAAPRNAPELTLGSGYTQGFGRVRTGTDVSDVAGAGIGVELGAGYRINPRWSVSASGQYQELTSANSTGARGLAANVGGTYHFEPLLRGDPFLRLAGGYRLLWQVNPSIGGPSMLRHGFELATAQLGYDVRVSDDIALAPVIGADLNLFVWERPLAGSTVALSSAQLNTFIYAGLQGRFDVGGTTTAAPAASEATRHEQTRLPRTITSGGRDP